MWIFMELETEAKPEVSKSCIVILYFTDLAVGAYLSQKIFVLR